VARAAPDRLPEVVEQRRVGGELGGVLASEPTGAIEVGALGERGDLGELAGAAAARPRGVIGHVDKVRGTPDAALISC
jgi:hypothetical protein